MGDQLRGLSAGVFGHSLIKWLVDEGRLASYNGPMIESSQIQPASFEFRIGNEVYVSRIIDRHKPLSKSGEKIAFEESFVLKRGYVYRFPLLERVDLPPGVYAIINAKSRIGRVLLQVRLIADSAPERYDEIPPGYRGPVSLEVVPFAYDYVIHKNAALIQARFMNAPLAEISLTEKEIREVYRSLLDRPENGRRGLLFYRDGEVIPQDQINFVEGRIALHTTLTEPNPDGQVVYLAKEGVSKPIDLAGGNKPEEFFESIGPREELIIQPRRGYLSSSKEVLYCPAGLIMVTLPFDPRLGKMEADHAGFIDPGFFGGLTFEPISHEHIPMVLHDMHPTVGITLARVIGVIPEEAAYGSRNVHMGQIGVNPGACFKKRTDLQLSL